MKPIWLVSGHCGEYSDYREWPVIAYEVKAAADEHARLATLAAAEIIAKHDGYYSIPPNANLHDPQMACDYTGTKYDVLMVELSDQASYP